MKHAVCKFNRRISNSYSTEPADTLVANPLDRNSETISNRIESLSVRIYPDERPIEIV